MQEDIKDPKTPKETEIDLGVFFSLIEKTFRKIGNLLSLFFISLFQFFIGILLFLRRKILWLAIGALIGLGFGLQRYISKGPTYYSEMLVKTNFQSTRPLYNLIDYFNSLIDQKRYIELSKNFGIQEGEAQRLISFEISPVDDYMETARLYRNTFLDHSRTGTVNRDTLWSNTVNFREFKNNLKPYDYPSQKIRLYSTNSSLYPKVQEGLVHLVNSNEILNFYKQGINGLNSDEVNILQRSLTGLDSLRQAYISKLNRPGTSGSNGNNIIISDTSMSSPEIAMVDKELLLKDELLQAKRKAIEEQDILQVYSGFSPTGIKVTDITRQSYIRYALWGLLAALALVLFIEFYKFLNHQERRNTRKTTV
ncbi:hypothetical protein OCK74_17175 [Chitinophagaceae bacterium LB-8]|uniref:Uncharacterized protein n=1 Tax=Paraflavisolibacter caeni TaxID=2982496 RepID=A0A9X2XXY6_9BACT|nr:hypothetical protein [Paraflavisolibacter caeni]MCU7550855.1 hypothetical protein [Paraflavisolibacter caeni]